MIRRAFTLIELMVVIAVLVMMASIAVPSVVALQRSRAERSTLESVGRLPSEARIRAREKGKTVTLAYESSQGELTLTQDDEQVGTVSLGNALQVNSVDLDDTDKSTSDVKFYEDGTADPATIRLTAGGSQRYLRIDKDGSSRWVDEPPQTNDERWQAGELEQRAAG
ncbi:hypothetical protein BH11ARM2_BH11ARM2_24240 [soil metagenome]